jgi:hypothetical protein
MWQLLASVCVVLALLGLLYIPFASLEATVAIVVVEVLLYFVFRFAMQRKSPKGNLEQPQK